LVVEPHDGGLGDGLVAPEVFDEPAVARAARVGGDEGVDGVLLAPHPAEAEFDGHCGVVLGFGLWVSGSRTRNQKREATAAYRPPRRLWRSTLRPFPVRRVIVFIIFFISRNCLRSWFTSCTFSPAPAAMRWRRLP